MSHPAFVSYVSGSGGDDTKQSPSFEEGGFGLVSLSSFAFLFSFSFAASFGLKTTVSILLQLLSAGGAFRRLLTTSRGKGPDELVIWQEKKGGGSEFGIGHTEVSRGSL